MAAPRKLEDLVNNIYKLKIETECLELDYIYKLFDGAVYGIKIDLLILPIENRFYWHREYLDCYLTYHNFEEYAVHIQNCLFCSYIRRSKYKITWGITKVNSIVVNKEEHRNLTTVPLR